MKYDFLYITSETEVGQTLLSGALHMCTDLLQSVNFGVDLEDVATNDLIVLLNTQLQKMVVD